MNIKKYRVDTDKGSYIVEVDEPDAPTLTASRQAASKSEFDANQPQSTMFSRGREMALGGLESLGVDPASPIMGTAKNLTGGVAALPGMAKQAITSPLQTAGAVASGLTEAPRQAIQGFKEGDYDKAAHGVGGTVGTVAPIAAGTGVASKALSGPADNLVAKAKHYLAGGKDKYVEQMIAPRGREAQAQTMKVAPKLAEDPLLARAKKAMFDQKMYERFKADEAALTAAEKSIPRGTMVQRDPILGEIKTAMDELQSFKSNPEIVSSPGAEKILAEWYNKLSKLPNQIPFEEVRDFRQKLDKHIYTHGGWRETATAAEKLEMEANRQVVNAMRKQTKGISKALDAADEAYSNSATGVASAGLDWETGRRLSSVNKPSSRQEMLDKAKKYLKRGAIGTGIVFGGGKLIGSE